MSWGMFAAIAGLGVAGLDPVGALILTTAIASGARRSAVLAFFASSLGVTVLVGVALGESVQRLVDLVVSLIQVPDPARFWLQLTAAVALTVWAVRRYRNRNQSSPSQSRRARGSSMPAMLAAGTAWGIAALTDPTFYATAALAGQSRGIVVPAVLVMVWFLISQLPLLAVTVTYLINSEGPAVTRLVALTKRLSMALSHVLTALLAFAALLLAASSATYLGTGLFLPL